MIHEARVIPLDGRPHVGPHVRTYMGDARGHFEGNSLVVETTNFKTPYRGSNPETLHLIERFTRVGPNSCQTVGFRFSVSIMCDAEATADYPSKADATPHRSRP